MGRGGARNIDRIGVEAVWLGEQFAKGFDEYNKRIDAANKATEGFSKTTQRSSRASSAAFNQFSKSVSGSMRSATRETTNYIQTAKDLQATFQEVGRTAQQFGAGLRDAASGRAITQSFQSLARESGVNADQLLANMKRAARGTVEELDLVRIANRALLAGGEQFANELPRLFEIARVASVATGQDIGFVFDTLTRGVAKASPLLIDNAEIYIKVGQAVEDFAEQAGKTTDELTQQERQLATLNAVLDEGEKFVSKIGSSAEVATDAYAQWDVRIQEATRDTIEFVEDALGPLAPALGAMGQGLESTLPLLQTMILLQGQGVLSVGALAGGVGSLVAALAPLAIGVGSIALTMKVFDEMVNQVGSSLPPVNETISKSADLIKLQTLRFVAGEAAANEWFRAQQGLPTLVELGNEAQQRNLQIMDEVTEEYRQSANAYQVYLQRVNEANANLEAGQIATTAMTEAQFNYERAIRSSTISVEDLIEAIQRLNEEQAGTNALLQVGANIRSAATATALLAADVAEKEAEAQERAADALKKRQELSEQGIHFQEQIADARLELLLAEEQAQAQVEQSARDHQTKMVEITRKGAQERAKAQRDFDKAVASAARTRQRALEDAARQHARNVQRIEEDHRRRLDEIENRFTQTVEEAAVERDAIAIFEARKRRAQELEEANRDREQGLEDENINFEDSKRQAEQAFRDQMEAARLALEERQRDIDRSIQEQQQKEQEAQRNRLSKQKSAQSQELLALRQYLNQIEADYRAHIARLKALADQVPSAIVPGQRRGGPMQEGGAGVITGPATFTVEPGVTEGFWFSGALGQSAPVFPSQEMAQTIGMQAAVGGAVDVALRGFSGNLMERIGPQMVEMVGQAVMDDLTDAFLQATVRR